MLAVFIVLFARLQCHVPAAHGDKGRLVNPKTPPLGFTMWGGGLRVSPSAAEDVFARTPELKMYRNLT